jgi:glycosyltransferase involved in cell wall biosynthesis
VKIAFVTSQSLSRHATIKRAWGLAPHLLGAGHEVAVIAEDVAENRATVAALPGLAAAYYPSGLSAFAERRAKEQLIERLQPGLVHICGLGWRNAVRRGNPRIRLVMDHVELESSIADQNPLRRWLQRRLERWSFGYYDGSVAASRYLEFEIRRHLFRVGQPRPLLYLPFAFEPAACVPEPARLQAARAQAAGRKTITYMGGLHAGYGVRDLAAAYRGDAALRASARLVFFGSGPEAAYLRGQSAERADGAVIECAGFVDEPTVIAGLFASDVLVSPLNDTVQDWARCPSKTYVYMATRRPIVTAPIGENFEALGSLGFYYRPGDAGSLAAALRRALGAAPEQPYPLERCDWAHRAEAYGAWREAEFP